MGPKIWRLRGIAMIRAKTIHGLLARLLIAICALNINGLFRMALAMEEVASFAILGASLVLIVSYGLRVKSAALVFFCATVLVYLGMGFASYDPGLSTIPPLTIVRAYLSSIFIVWAITAYTGTLGSRAEIDSLLTFVLVCFSLSALSVWLSPLLYTLYTVLPPADLSRFGGFFGNPNEAAICSLIAFSLAAGLPNRRPWIQWPLIVLSAGAVVLTFSKTGICVLIVLMAWFATRKATGWAVALVPLIGAVAAVSVAFLPDLARTVAESETLDLTINQKERIIAVGDILEGRITEETSTGRTELWRAGLEHAVANFPKAHGLGSYHNFVGGLLNGDRQWFGVHNTFLMVFGEAGPIGLFLLILTVILSIVGILRSPFRRICLPIGLILLVDMMVNHNALVHRYFDVSLGLILGLAAVRVGEAAKSRDLSNTHRRGARLGTG